MGIGRPRSEETLRRDDSILGALDGPVMLTRNEIAEAIGENPQLVYLALVRLRDQGKVRKVDQPRLRHHWERL